MHKLLLTALLLTAAATARAEDPTMVATLLPPPDESIMAATQNIVPATNTPAPGTVSIPVLKQAIQKGDTITAENLTTQQIPAAQAYPSTVDSADALIGQQALRSLAAATPINRMQVRVAPSVSRNQAVTILFKRGGVELSGRGQALEDGQLGQSIRVINPATRSTLVGTIAAGGVVEIN